MTAIPQQIFKKKVVTNYCLAIIKVIWIVWNLKKFPQILTTFKDYKLFFHVESAGIEYSKKTLIITCILFQVSLEVFFIIDGCIFRGHFLGRLLTEFSIILRSW